MQRRNKVGGIIDRRLGEYDPNMSADEKMVERFAREKQRLFKRSSMFDIEDVGLPEDEDTPSHKPMRDDFDDRDSQNLGSDSADGSESRLKRSHVHMALDGDGKILEYADDENGQPQRKKTKSDVMKEVIARSKQQKYGRQLAKEENDDLRAKLDANFVHAEVQKIAPSAEKEVPHAATEFSKSFLMASKALLQNSSGKAELSTRTNTAGELAIKNAETLREVEDKRLRRMRGEQFGNTDSEEDEDKDNNQPAPNVTLWAQDDDQGEFGLGRGNRTKPTATELGCDDEDDFLIEDDLVASGSEVDPIADAEESADDGVSDHNSDSQSNGGMNHGSNDFEAQFEEHGIPSSLPCPRTHDELLCVTKSMPLQELAVAITKIRTQYHPRLANENKERLAQFSRVLVQNISHQGNSNGSSSFAPIEAVARHIHSMAKLLPFDVSAEFRSQIEEISRDRPLDPTLGDLAVLVAIGSTFPTSDHFHQVVTPAMLIIARYLGQKIPKSLSDYAKGIFVTTLAYQYQSFSKRYVPEVLNCLLNTLCALAPVPFPPSKASFPLHKPRPGTAVENLQHVQPRKLKMSDLTTTRDPAAPEENEGQSSTAATLKISLLDAILQLIPAFSTLWFSSPAYPETFAPTCAVLAHLSSESSLPHFPPVLRNKLCLALSDLKTALNSSLTSRSPLLLHNHRPLPIKQQIPRFEQTGFDPDKHYDPDAARSEARKLKVEYRREKKGAMRELRKDAHFLAREKLREKIARDDAYDRKFRRIIAEIQTTEGQERNEYEREKTKRKRERERDKEREMKR